MKKNIHLKLVILFGILILIPACKSTELAKVNSVVTPDMVEKDGLISIDTKHTILKVRTAKNKKGNYIVGSGFEGMIMGIDYTGKTLWSNKLSGFMNHDVWCADIDGDDQDEILAANADGNIYCLDAKGQLKWKFKNNDVPMYSVTMVTKDKTNYVVAGSFDKNIYYLSAEGKLVKTVPSSLYGKQKKGKKGKSKAKEHVANLMRPLQKEDGSTHLVMHAASSSMQGKGTVYFFEPLSQQPYKSLNLKNKKPIGDLRITNYFGEGKEEILAGTSAIIGKSLPIGTPFS